MKKILLTAICVSTINLSALAQGTFNFGNSASTQWLLYETNTQVLSTNSGNLGGFLFELYVAPAGTSTDVGFIGTGIMATNVATAGRLNGGNGIAVPGAPPGGTGAVLVRGWSSNLGPTYAAAFDAWNGFGRTFGYLGTSAIASQFLWGGDAGSGPVSASTVFGSASGIQTGMTLFQFPTPEPSCVALTGLGAASLLIFRRKK